MDMDHLGWVFFGQHILVGLVGREPELAASEWWSPLVGRRMCERRPQRAQKSPDTRRRAVIRAQDSVRLLLGTLLPWEQGIIPSHRF